MIIDLDTGSCIRGCPDGECYCSEPSYGDQAYTGTCSGVRRLRRVLLRGRVSRAEPMGHARRRELYRYPCMTDRQGRRYRKKLRRELGTFLAGDGHYPGELVPVAERNKQRATPRQRKPRRDG